MECATPVLIDKATRPLWVTWSSSAAVYTLGDLMARHPSTASMIVFGVIMATLQTTVVSLLRGSHPTKMPAGRA